MITERVRATDLQPHNVLVAADRKTFPILATFVRDGDVRIVTEINGRSFVVPATTWFVRMVTS